MARIVSLAQSVFALHLQLLDCLRTFTDVPTYIKRMFQARVRMTFFFFYFFFFILFLEKI